MLLSDPSFMTAIKTFLQTHPDPITVPGLGIFSPSNAKFNGDGSYILPSPIPPTHKLDAPIERLELLVPHVPMYLELVRKVLDLKPYQEAAASKGKFVADLESSITADQTKIKDLEAQLLKEEKEKESAKPQGFSFKSVKAKISSKQELPQKDTTEFIKTEIAQRNRTLQESTATLEKAKVAAQLANSDSAAFVAAQTDLIKFLNETMSSFDTYDTALLQSATIESESLHHKVQSDIKTFQAAVDVARKIYSNLSAAHKSIAVFKKANPQSDANLFSQQNQFVKKRYEVLMAAEAKYAEARKDAEVLIKIVPALEPRLPEFRLKVPELFIEHAFPNYTPGPRPEYDDRFNAFQEFVVDKNISISFSHIEILLPASQWLRDAIESMTLHETMVKSDLNMKETELNVFRMGCFEIVADGQSGRAKLDEFGIMKLLA
ncbi:hypothetical protein HDU97_002692 [Phlyctochytrium planicorne]|nr:hypothetical protein HDU97_002692 [Phlyctochytrium planicorne]